MQEDTWAEQHPWVPPPAPPATSRPLQPPLHINFLLLRAKPGACEDFPSRASCVRVDRTWGPLRCLSSPCSQAGVRRLGWALTGIPPNIRPCSPPEPHDSLLNSSSTPKGTRAKCSLQVHLLASVCKWKPSRTETPLHPSQCTEAVAKALPTRVTSKDTSVSSSLRQQPGIGREECERSLHLRLTGESLRQGHSEVLV